MARKNPTNERVKLTYFQYLKHADGKSEQTIRQVEKAILRFEEFTGFADFKTFGQKQAIDFKARLAHQELALATILSTVNNLKRFLAWLATQPGYRRRINPNEIAYLNLPERDVRAASAPASRKYPSLLMIERAVSMMPAETQIQKRDRALVTLAAVTNIRAGALVSLRVKHLDVSRMLVVQDPKEVPTKFGKRIDTFLLPLNEQFEAIVLEWRRFLRVEMLFGDDDPLFPKTAMGQDENNCFKATGLSREHWANASQARAIFKAAFREAELPEFTPHSFRHMIVSEMYRRGLSVAEFKAWSQNLGHEGAMTTLNSYGTLSVEEQGHLIRKSAAPAEEAPLTQSALEAILRKRGL